MPDTVPDLAVGGAQDTGMRGELSLVRRAMRRRRRELTPVERSARARHLARHIAVAPWFLRAQRVACYLPVDGEMSPVPLMTRAWAMGKNVYLPVLDPLCARLWFARYRDGDPLALNRFGIPEPVHTDERRVPPWALDLVLAPLVAFDSDGNRLGMGGGFYDRTFSYLRRRRAWRKPLFVGLAYDFQHTPGLPRRTWDVPLHACATESAIHRWHD